MEFALPRWLRWDNPVQVDSALAFALPSVSPRAVRATTICNSAKGKDDEAAAPIHEAPLASALSNDSNYRSIRRPAGRLGANPKQN